MGLTPVKLFVGQATSEAINTYDEATPEEVASAVVQAHEVWQTWRMTTFTERAMLMKKTANFSASAGRSSRCSWPQRWASR